MLNKHRVAIVGVLVAVLSSASTASASLALRQRLVVGLNGTRSTILREALSPNTGGGGVETVRMISDPQTNTSGFLQTGYLRQDTSSDCGTASGSQLYVMVERGQLGQTALYCNRYAIPSTDNSDRFAVVESAVDGTWGAYKNGSLIEPNHALGTGFTSGWAQAAGEYVGTGANVRASWGPTNTTPWQLTTCRGCSYTTIAAGSTQQPGGWFIGNV